MQLFNSVTRIRKGRSFSSSSRELLGVEFLLARGQSRSNARAGGGVVAFTSANPGEGVSHVVQFFAEKLATQTGEPTLVVNAERLRSLHFTELINMPGMRAKVGKLWLDSEEVSGHDNGRGEGTGKAVAHEKLRQLKSETGLDLLQALGAGFGYTLLDCPSISTSYEAAVLAPDVAGVVLVVEADRTKRDQILRASLTIEMAKGNLMGLVLNRRRHVVPERFYRRL